MKKIDVTLFSLKMKEEVDNFENYQLTYSHSCQKTMAEWVSSFMDFAGYGDDEVVEEDLEEEFDDELYYGSQDFRYEELVNRRKYRSFRDDDSY